MHQNLKSEASCWSVCRKKQKENQEDLLAKANNETMRALKSNDSSGPVTIGRKVSTIEAYRKVEDIPSTRELAILVSAPSHGTADMRCLHGDNRPCSS